MGEIELVELIASTGSARMDAVVRRLIAEMHTVLPGQLRAVYVLGSYADASAVSTSDLDLELIIADHLLDDERARIQAFLAGFASSTEGELDIGFPDEDSLRAGVSPILKLGGRLLWGVDLRQTLDLMPLAAWTRDRMHTSYWRLFGLFSRPLPLAMPLDYPDPADEFYGYARRLTRLPDGRDVAGTRDLMRSVGWMATALVAYQASQYVATKRDCASMYRTQIGDEWSDLLDDMAEWVRGGWQYRIPADPEERARLRAICARTLGFENHFLMVYRDYALAELRGEDPAGRQMARETLQRVPLADAVVMEAVAMAEREMPDQ
ncbi:MAG TPA: hypothetical protein VFW76_02980 [Ktedonobacterales bacterium]|nr:hypothetical protein [Ktedonobacterales bacterium]